jgi:hypothetical protein
MFPSFLNGPNGNNIIPPNFHKKVEDSGNSSTDLYQLLMKDGNPALTILM